MPVATHINNTKVYKDHGQSIPPHEHTVRNTAFHRRLRPPRLVGGARPARPGRRIVCQRSCGPCTLPARKAITTPVRCAAHRPVNASNLKTCLHQQQPQQHGQPLQGATPERLGRPLSPAVCAPFSHRMIDKICLKCDRAISPG